MNASLSPKNYGLGALAGLLVAVTGAYGWVLLTGATGRPYGAFAVLVGVLTGSAVRWGTRQSSIGAGALGGIFTLVALIGARHFIRRNALLKIAIANGYTGLGPTSLLDTLRTLNGWDWLFIAMSVYFAVTLPLRAAPKPSEPPTS